MNNSIFCAVFVISSVINPALGLKCYQCTDIDSKCVTEESDFGIVVDCPPNADACLKANAETLGVSTYARSCGMLGGGRNGDCVIQESGSLGQANVCYCTDNACNAGHERFDNCSSSVNLLIAIFLYHFVI